MKDSHPLQFLDVNCALSADTPAASLLAKMDEFGIAEACPSHTTASRHNLREGNAALLQQVAGHPRLRPVWTVSPHHTNECLPPSELIRAMRQHDVRLARVSFGHGRYVPRFDLFLFEPLLDALAAARVPLLLHFQDIEAVPIAKIADALRRWPGLRLILSLPKITFHDRWFYALWEQFDTFFVELSGYQILGGIEAVTRRFGANRLVYGSRLPFFTPVQSMLQVIYSEVDDAAKRAIAGDTVRQLMREAHP